MCMCNLNKKNIERNKFLHKQSNYRGLVRTCDSEFPKAFNVGGVALVNDVGCGPTKALCSCCGWRFG